MKNDAWALQCYIRHLGICLESGVFIRTCSISRNTDARYNNKPLMSAPIQKPYDVYPFWLKEVQEYVIISSLELILKQLSGHKTSASWCLDWGWPRRLEGSGSICTQPCLRLHLLDGPPNLLQLLRLIAASLQEVTHNIIVVAAHNAPCITTGMARTWTGNSTSSPVCFSSFSRTYRHAQTERDCCCSPKHPVVLCLT